MWYNSFAVAFEESKANFAIHAKEFVKKKHKTKTKTKQNKTKQKKPFCCFDFDVHRVESVNDDHVSCTCRAYPTQLLVVVPTSTGQQQPVK